MRKDITVKALMNANKKITPLSIIWDDEREFIIDKILDARPAPSKGGGFGIRYEVQISGKIRYIYLDGYVWFIDFNN